MQILIISLAILISCNGVEKKKLTQDNNLIETDTTKNQNSLSFDIFCFYELDKKYSNETNSIKIEKWMETKLVEIENQKVNGRNILEHNGGGPNGAEWNPSTNLYLIITTPKIADTQLLEIELNNKHYSKLAISKKVPIHKKGTIFWLELKRDFWESNMRKIKDEDFEVLYGKKMLKGIEKGDFHPITPLNTGKVLEINIKIGEQQIKKYFHAAYGE